MMKFIALLKKELKELFTLQIIGPLVISVGLFAVVGQIVGGEIEKTKEPQPVLLIDNDKSELSDGVAAALAQANFSIKNFNGTKDEAVVQAKAEDISAIIIIPAKFTEKVMNAEPQTIDSYTVFENFSLLAGQRAQLLNSVIQTINDFVSNQLISASAGGINPDSIKNPIKASQFVVVGNREVLADPASVVGFVSSQAAFIPIILTIVIIFSATMIATAIATEKENKTLETLLSAPVGRNSIVLAKMVGAGLVSLVAAGIYMFGFRYYMNGLTGGALDSASADPNISSVIERLGLSFAWQDYFVLGLVLFLGILCALAIAVVLGVFAEDVKSVNGLISPLMILIIFPYFLVMFLDVNTLSLPLKILIYLNPFSYPFLAAPNLFMDNYRIIFYGAVYQMLFFAVFVYIAAKIFSTEKIMTIKLNFSRKR